MGWKGGAAVGLIMLGMVTISQAADSRATPPVQPIGRAVTPVITSAPVISGLNPTGCYQRGATFSILGRGFGAAPAGRTPALLGSGFVLRLIVNSWSDTRIQVRLPDDPRILSGQRYDLGILSAEGRWLSRLESGLEICRSPASSFSAKQPGTDSDATASGGGVEGGSFYAENGGESTAPPGGGGSLLGQDLPSSPDVTAFADEDDRDEQSEPDELLVVSPDLPRAEKVRQLAQGLGLGIKRRSVLKGLGLVVSVFRVPQGTTPREAVQKLRTQAPELRVDLNHRLTPQGDDRHDYPSHMIHWPVSTGNCCKGLRIGLVDGPLPESHSVLAGATIERHSFITQGVTPGPTDHALAVAAILVGGDGRGLTASARLYVAEVMRLRDDEHVDTTVDGLVQGLDWLVQQRVDLINLSLGGPHNLVLDAAVQRLRDLDIPVIAAAGNGGPSADPVYPAALPGVIAVTAIDAERRLYRQANRGGYISFAAPGVDIWVPRGRDAAYVSGTSYAAPYVTALLVLERQRLPTSTWSERLQALIDSAVDLGEPGRDNQFGYGLPLAPGG